MFTSFHPCATNAHNRLSLQSCAGSDHLTSEPEITVQKVLRRGCDAAGTRPRTSHDNAARGNILRSTSSACREQSPRNTQAQKPTPLLPLFVGMSPLLPAPSRAYHASCGRCLALDLPSWTKMITKRLPSYVQTIPGPEAFGPKTPENNWGRGLAAVLGLVSSWLA